jgi:hypothetical protein
MNQQTLIFTLDTEPQVVTLALDLLRAKGYPIGDVVVLHTVAAAMQPVLARLQEQFAVLGACGFRTMAVEGDAGRWTGPCRTATRWPRCWTFRRCAMRPGRRGRGTHRGLAEGKG